MILFSYERENLVNYYLWHCYLVCGIICPGDILGHVKCDFNFGSVYTRGVFNRVKIQVLYIIFPIFFYNCLFDIPLEWLSGRNASLSIENFDGHNGKSVYAPGEYRVFISTVKKLIFSRKYFLLSTCFINIKVKSIALNDVKFSYMNNFGIYIKVSSQSFYIT